MRRNLKYLHSLIKLNLTNCKRYSTLQWQCIALNSLSLSVVKTVVQQWIVKFVVYLSAFSVTLLCTYILLQPMPEYHGILNGFFWQHRFVVSIGGLPVVVYVYEYLIVTVDQSWTSLSSVLCTCTNVVIVILCTGPLSAVNGMGI